MLKKRGILDSKPISDKDLLNRQRGNDSRKENVTQSCNQSKLRQHSLDVIKPQLQMLLNDREVVFVDPQY